jgi:hypothetical protein
MAEWARVANTTISEHIREVEDNIMRNRRVLAILKKKGRIQFNASGKDFDWRIKFRRAPIAGYADADTLTFARRDRWRVATLPWRGYAIGESATKKEKLMNKGTEAIVKLFAELGNDMTEDIEDQYCEELYVDGNATGNGKKIHGFESFLGNSATGNDNGRVRQPNSTYAGLSCALGAFGGTWAPTGTGTGTWPDGKGDASYDFWSPVIVDCSASVWGGSPNWSAYAPSQLSFGIMANQMNKYNKGGLEMVMLDRLFYYQFLELIRSKERLNVQRGKDGSPLVSLGFGDVVEWDGKDITWEYGMTASTGYGFNPAQMELKSMQDKLFVFEGPEYNMATGAYNMRVDTFSNLRCNPRGFVKWLNAT